MLTAAQHATVLINTHKGNYAMNFVERELLPSYKVQNVSPKDNATSFFFIVV